MNSPKNILVVTTSTLENVKIEKYLKPISAHVVAGTDAFSDLFASFSDIFGGRSDTYQKQISSIYNEAINKLKIAAFEMGANCILDLKIDADEISGKGKSMFMLTAIGTAAIVEKTSVKTNDEKTRSPGIVTADAMKNLKRKKEILSKIESGQQELDEDFWDFVTSNQVEEVFPFLLNAYSKSLTQPQLDQYQNNQFQLSLMNYLDNFSDEVKLDLIYNAMGDVSDPALIRQLLILINKLQLLNIEQVKKLLYSSNFTLQKRALTILHYDKPYYEEQDIEALNEIIGYISQNFKERGTRSTKKQMLSSKEKEVWICECSKANDGYGTVNEFCSSCGNNIWGFKSQSAQPLNTIKTLSEKINLIRELI